MLSYTVNADGSSGDATSLYSGNDGLNLGWEFFYIDQAISWFSLLSPVEFQEITSN